MPENKYYKCLLKGLNSLGPVYLEALSVGDAEYKFKKQIETGYSNAYTFKAIVVSKDEFDRKGEPEPEPEEEYEPELDDEDLDEEDEDED